MSKPENDLTETCSHSGVGRRAFFDRLLKLGIAGAITGAVATFAPAGLLTEALAAPPPNQNEWRRCSKCRALFYNGYPNKGRCPAGQRHSALMGADYFLTYNSPGPGQSDWRFCNKCHTLVWNGYPNKGVCPAGGGHVAQGFNFTLLHDTKAAKHQENWRFCNKCEALFYDFDSDKGVCAARGVHVAAGYHFILRFKGNLEDDYEQNPGA